MTDRPPLMHLGDALRWFRSRHGMNQAEAGIKMGLNPSSAQRLVSMREQPLGAPDYIAPTIAELVNLEDATGVPRGTILRHAGYVASAESELPPDVSPITLAGIRALLAADAEQQAADRPIRAQRRAGRVRPRNQATE